MTQDILRFVFVFTNHHKSFTFDILRLNEELAVLNSLVLLYCAQLMAIKTPSLHLLDIWPEKLVMSPACLERLLELTGQYYRHCQVITILKRCGMLMLGPTKFWKC